MTVDLGVSLDILFNFFEAGFLNSHTASIDWGDGSIEDPSGISLSSTPGSPGIATTGTVSSSHIYDAIGNYTLTYAIFDDNGGSHFSSTQVTVNDAPVSTPEPTALILMGIGLAGLGFSRRKIK